MSFLFYLYLFKTYSKQLDGLKLKLLGKILAVVLLTTFEDFSFLPQLLSFGTFFYDSLCTLHIISNNTTEIAFILKYRQNLRLQ